MEVSGRGASTRPSAEHEMTSDDVSHGNKCEHCEDDGITTDADGYCTDCVVFLCSGCIKSHNRQKVLKNHTFLKGTDMPSEKQEKTGTVECSQHPGEAIKIYCKTEHILGCVLCFTMGHQSCDKALISDMCKYFENSEEVRDIRKTSKEKKKSVNQYRNVIEAYHLMNNKCYDESLKDFQTFRRNIVGKLDRHGAVVKAEAGRHKDENKRKLDAFTDTVTSLDKEMSSFITEIEVNQKIVVHICQEQSSKDKIKGREAS